MTFNYMISTIKKGDPVALNHQKPREPTKLFAELDNSIESLDGEIHSEIHVAKVWELYTEVLVHGCELQLCRCPNSILVQC